MTVELQSAVTRKHGTHRHPRSLSSMNRRSSFPRLSSNLASCHAEGLIDMNGEVCCSIPETKVQHGFWAHYWSTLCPGWWQTSMRAHCLYQSHLEMCRCCNHRNCKLYRRVTRKGENNMCCDKTNVGQRSLMHQAARAHTKDRLRLHHLLLYQVNKVSGCLDDFR